ncbi:MAG TPA: FAD-dependent oxidoreductase [Roseiflexaceae bacterium]|nr:FAD-dependent oxidoreductase [Roseiflexaceae bacterium]
MSTDVWHAARHTKWPAAQRLVEQPEDALVDQALDVLAQVLGVPWSRIEEQLIDTHSHNWHADPFSRGAYSCVAVVLLSGTMAVMTACSTLRRDSLFRVRRLPG